jgi:hypothetical protein
MYLIGEGRKAYLDFIKNVPIQAFFFFMSFVFCHGGLQGHPAAIKWVIGIIFGLMGAAAAVASSSLFADSVRENVVAPARARAFQKYPSTNGDAIVWGKQFIKRWWLRKRALAEVFLVVLAINLCFQAAVISALLSAINALRMNT